MLNQSGVVRNDIRSSVAGLSETADGVPLTIDLTVVSSATCEVLAARAVYVSRRSRPPQRCEKDRDVANRGAQNHRPSGLASFLG
jgi:hypothetical protein